VIYTTRASIDYLKEGTGDLCQRLGITLIPLPENLGTQVEGPIFSLISFFTALANHYQLSFNEIKEKFA
jgi:hypothetical protein